MITAPTPPTPPTPPARLESTSPRMIQIEPPSSPVPKVFSRIHEIREAQKQSQAEEYSDENYSESEEYTESEDYSEEYSDEEYTEEVPEVESVTIPATSSEPVARDRVQTHYRSEDGNFESTSSTEREPIQTNNRMPGQVQPYEVTEQVADARGKLIVEQFRKLEEAREKQQSNQSNQTQQTRIDIPRVNPSDYKSSTGTIIFTIAAILVLVVVAFFTLRKSVLQKAKAKMSAENQPAENLENVVVENIPAEKNSAVSLSIKRAPIKKVETKVEQKIETKSILQIKRNSIKKIDPVPIKTEPIHSEIPVDEVKSVDRDPDEKKIKGLNFEIRV